MAGWKLVLLALAAVIGLAFAYAVLPVLIIISGMSIVGIPLALVLMVVPALVLWGGSFFVPWHLLGRTPRAAAIGIAVAALVVLLPPMLVNSSGHRRMQALLASERADPTPPLDGRSVAVRLPTHTRGRYIDCSAVCLQLLAAGRVGRFLVENRADPGQPPDGDKVVRSYRLEHRADCAQLNVPQAFKDAFAAATAGGRCLIEEQTRLAMADYVISAGRIADGKSRYRAGLSLSADTISAWRTVVWHNDGGRFKEVFRQTEVEAHPLWPVLTPGVVFGFGLEAAPGFMRRTVKQNPGTASRFNSTEMYLAERLDIRRQ